MNSTIIDKSNKRHQDIGIVKDDPYFTLILFQDYEPPKIVELRTVNSNVMKLFSCLGIAKVQKE